MSSSSVVIRQNSAFKVPTARKPRVNDCNAMSGANTSGRISTGGKSVTYGAPFLLLVQKLYTNPSSLTGHEMLALQTHPVISTLMETAARLNLPIHNFFIPVESIQKPYDQERIQIYFRERVQVVVSPEMQQASLEEKTAHSETDVSEHAYEKDQPLSIFSADSTHKTELTESAKVGFYTKKERLEKIRKYKVKKMRAISNQGKKNVKYAKKSQVAMKRARVNGKFVKS